MYERGKVAVPHLGKGMGVGTADPASVHQEFPGPPVICPRQCKAPRRKGKE